MTTITYSSGGTLKTTGHSGITGNDTAITDFINSDKSLYGAKSVSNSTVSATGAIKPITLKTPDSGLGDIMKTDVSTVTQGVKDLGKIDLGKIDLGSIGYTGNSAGPVSGTTPSASTGKNSVAVTPVSGLDISKNIALDYGNGEGYDYLDSGMKDITKNINTEIDTANAAKKTYALDDTANPNKTIFNDPAAQNANLMDQNNDLAEKVTDSKGMSGFETAQVGLGVVNTITQLASVAISAYYARKNYELQKEDRAYARSRDAKNDAHQAQIQANFDLVG